MEKVPIGDLKGYLVDPTDSLYDEKRKVWNGAIDKYPAAVVVCESENDVVSAVQLAKDKSLSVSIKGGGHHLAGTATCNDGIMIDLSEMKKVEVVPQEKIAYVEGGATLGLIDKETQKYGLATPTGTVSETGVAGLALNGGLGYLRGKHGLTCDNIKGFHIVTPDGVLQRVDQDSHPDLFWAVRGGGGNFGVITKFEFELHSVGPNVLALDVMYDYKDAKAILEKAQVYVDDAPDEVSFNLTMTQLPPAPFLPTALHHRKVIMVTGMYAGDPENGEHAIEPLRELAEPILDQTGVMSYVDLQSKLDPMVQSNIPVFGTSLYFTKLDEKVIDELMGRLEHVPSQGFIVQLWSLSGKMNRIPSDENAFSIRDASFVLLVDVMALANDQDTCQKWVNDLYQHLLPLSHQNASYLNGIGLDEDVTKNAFGNNYERLLEIKRKYDPSNMFKHNHNIK